MKVTLEFIYDKLLTSFIISFLLMCFHCDPVVFSYQNKGRVSVKESVESDTVVRKSRGRRGTRTSVISQVMNMWSVRSWTVGLFSLNCLLKPLMVKGWFICFNSILNSDPLLKCKLQLFFFRTHTSCLCHSLLCGSCVGLKVYLMKPIIFLLASENNLCVYV